MTPVEVAYTDGFYYLTSWDDGRGNMLEYCMDRMGKAGVFDRKATRNAQIDHHVYDGSECEHFGRVDSEEVRATLEVSADGVEIVTGRFGDDVELVPIEDGRTWVHVRIRKSELFFGVVAGMGKKVTIVGLRSLVDERREYLKGLLEE